MEQSFITYDKYEFINAIIGWLGTNKLYLEVLEVSEKELQDLIQDEKSEEFEEKLAESLSKLSIDDMNQISERYDLGCKVKALN